MGVDYDAFLSWAENKFGKENIKFRRGNREICTHSMFVEEDHKFHLWMNPDGGNKGRENGAYRCWKSTPPRTGSLVGLVSELDGISYEQAEELICNSPSLRTLEQKVHRLFESYSEERTIPVESNDSINLPLFTQRIDDMEEGGWKEKAVAYLTNRKVPTEGLYVCTGGDFKNRIVIPYYDSHGRMIYFNARTMSKDDKVLKYMKPDGTDIQQSDLLYFPKWPRPGEKVLLMEGEFDSKSIHLAGFYAAACGGKSLSDQQIQLLRGYIPVLAFDTDKSGQDVGRQAMVSIGKKLLENGFPEVYYIRPPRQYKDWNKVHQERGLAVLHKYVEANQRRFGAWTEDHLKTTG
jgi:hypothetical protein